MLDGITKVPRTLGGVKIPSLRRLSIAAWQAARSASVAPHTSSGVRRCGLSGAITAVNGSVADACSPGMSLAGTGRSSTGKIGRPVSRSSTNSMPVLVACSTAGSIAASWVTVTSAGGDALS